MALLLTDTIDLMCAPPGPPTRSPRTPDNRARLDQVCMRLAELTGRPPEEIRADMRPPGRFLSAEDAAGYGLVERVAAPAGR